MDIKETRRQHLLKALEGFSSLEEFALATESNPKYISQLKNGTRNIGDKTRKRLEGALRAPANSWDKPILKNEVESNVSPLLGLSNEVPLISWVSAGKWCESPDEYQPGDAEEWMPKPKGSGDRTFALRVDGDSMTSPFPGQRSYPHGTIIYVDPDRVVTNNSRVVGRANGEYTFKTYVEDAGRKYLKPINPTYDKTDITEDTRICGVVIGSYTPE